MNSNTATAPSGTKERRELSFNSLDDVIAEAERLAAGDVRVTGNHTFGQILEHLARTAESSVGKIVPPPPPWFVRTLIIPLMKKSILNGPSKPGFKLPTPAQNFFWPSEEVDVQQGLARLRESFDLYKTKGPLAVHPVFGKATREQIDNLNITHAAMHLSFVHPA